MKRDRDDDVGGNGGGLNFASEVNSGEELSAAIKSLGGERVSLSLSDVYFVGVGDEILK